jgi:NAD(P)-dependent dehydrogenase (short-subunit alcohol dehydrogenase family)
MKTSGNTVLTAGGTSGIGLELAARLSKLGNQVIVPSDGQMEPGRVNRRTFRERKGHPRGTRRFSRKNCSRFRRLAVPRAGLEPDSRRKKPQAGCALTLYRLVIAGFVVPPCCTQSRSVPSNTPLEEDIEGT